jgi:hypothetical protein
MLLKRHDAVKRTITTAETKGSESENAATWNGHHGLDFSGLNIFLDS